LLASFGSSSRAQAFPWSCDLVATPDESQSCALNHRWTRQMSVGLHYGSLHTQSLSIEVLRTSTTQQQLEQLLSMVTLELAITPRDDGKSGFVELKGRVTGDRLVFELQDINASTFYIAEIRISAPEKQNLEYLVQSIFGPRALAVVSAKVRN
jgi:hypothetical protein